MDTTSNVGIKELNDKINKESAFIDMLMMEMNKVIVPKTYDRTTFIDYFPMAIFC